MMGEVVERVGNHDITRRLLHEVASGEQFPVFHQVIVGGVLERFAALDDSIVESGDELFAALG